MSSKWPFFKKQKDESCATLAIYHLMALKNMITDDAFFDNEKMLNACRSNGECGKYDFMSVTMVFKYLPQILQSKVEETHKCINLNTDDANTIISASCIKEKS